MQPDTPVKCQDPLPMAKVIRVPIDYGLDIDGNSEVQAKLTRCSDGVFYEGTYRSN